eukprot:7150129-Prymnesium_polylepis.1
MRRRRNTRCRPRGVTPGRHRAGRSSSSGQSTGCRRPRPRCSPVRLRARNILPPPPAPARSMPRAPPEGVVPRGRGPPPRSQRSR